MKNSKFFAGYALSLYENTLREHRLLDDGKLDTQELKVFVQDYNNYLCGISSPLNEFLDKAYKMYKDYMRDCERVNSIFKDMYASSLSELHVEALKK